MANIKEMLLEEPSLDKGREVITIAKGEVDYTAQFMAPIHQEKALADVARVEGIRHRRGHSRTSSILLYSDTASQEPLINRGPQAIVKLCVVGRGGEHTEIRLLLMGEEESFEQLVDRIKGKLSASRLKLKYKDAEGDMIVVTDDDDLRAALGFSVSDPGYRLTLWCHLFS